MVVGRIAVLLLLLFAAPAVARDDWREAHYERPKIETPYNLKKIAFETFDGGVKGDFIERPTFFNTLGNFIVNFTPAAVAADIRDFAANLQKSYKADFHAYKKDVILAGAGFIPVIGESKKIKALYSTGKELREIRQIERLARFAPALESGLTRKLQTSIVHSLDEGIIIGVRKRVYTANFLDGKIVAKPADAVVQTAYKNGVRKLSDGSRVISDLDMAFVAKNQKALNESKALDVGRKINDHYGNPVIMHGDNLSGVKKGIQKAIDVEKNGETIFIFSKNGFLDSGDYRSMVEKYTRGAR